jgi:hypothetical protein
VNLTNRDRVIVAALLAGALLAGVVELLHRPEHPQPAPAPAPGVLSLRGAWVGPTAADDASAFAGLCRGMVRSLEIDLEKGRITTGVQIEDLRVAACEGAFLPRSLSRDQPAAMAIVGRYLDTTVGKSGGPVDESRKREWIAALEALAQAAEESLR